MLVSFWHVPYTSLIHKTRPLRVVLLHRERVVNDISYNNACNRMLDVTCHRNLETTYLKDLEEGGGEVLEDYC
jgi:hypothetical protein